MIAKLKNNILEPVIGFVTRLTYASGSTIC